MSCSGTLARGVGTGLVLLVAADGAKKKKTSTDRSTCVHVCLLARATRAVEGRKSKGAARSGRTGARTESKSVKIGSHVQWLDDKVFLPLVFFHKATYVQRLQGDGSVHAAPRCEGRLNSPNFQRRSKGRPRKKKTREKTKITKWERNH